MAERRKCYEILGLENDATEEDIKKAYKKLALQFHPDKNSSEDAKTKFQEIGYAYKYLTDGPRSFETSDPHDLREEFLRRLFEDLFFPRYHQQHYHGGFPFSFAYDDDNTEDYCYQSDSSDNNCYRAHPFSRFHAQPGMGTYQNPHAGQTGTSFQQPSAKQQRKIEKRQRHRERARENRRRQKKEDKRKAEQMYTDDINTEPNQPSTPEEVEKQDSCDKDDGNNDTVPSKAFPTSKMNKKERKKLDSEQRKREKEMEEIAAELKQKQEKDLERLKEKERQAAKKKEEEQTNTFDVPNFYAQKEKKSRKAQQREKKRQEAAANSVQLGDGNVSTGPNLRSVPKPQPNVASSYTGFSSNITRKDEKSPAFTAQKKGRMGNRFDILEELNDSDDNCSISKEEFSDNNCMPHENSRKGVYGKANISNMHNNDSNFRNDVCQEFGHKSDDSGYHGNKHSNSTGTNQENGASNIRKDEYVDFDDEDHKFVENWGDYCNEDDDENGYESDIKVSDAGNKMSPNISSGFDKSRNSVYNQNPSQRSRGYHPNNSHQENGHFGRRGVPKEFVPRTRGYGGPGFQPRFRAPNNFHRFRGPFPPRQGPCPPRPFNFHGYYGMSPQQHNFRGGYPTHPPFGYHPNGRPVFSDGATMGMPQNPQNFKKPFRDHKSVPDDKKGNADKLNSSSKSRISDRKLVPDSTNPDDTQNSDKVEIAASFKDLKFKPAGNDIHVSSSSENTFPTKVYYNQACPKDTLDLLDDIEDIPNSCEANRSKTDLLSGLASSVSDIDMGIDKFLSRDKLGVPKGIFSDNIKNYYK